MLDIYQLESIIWKPMEIKKTPNKIISDMAKEITI